MTLCHFTSCGQNAYYQIRKGDQTIPVCGDCRDYYMDEGWVLAGFLVGDMVEAASEAKRP